jgi:hypothetical protein
VADLVRHYLATWNETDPARRRAIDQLWAVDGSYIDPLVEVTGRGGRHSPQPGLVPLGTRPRRRRGRAGRLQPGGRNRQRIKEFVMTATTPVAAPAERQAEPRRSRWLLPTILIATFVTALDAFIVNVAIPSLQRNLHASAGEITWVVAGYVITLAVGLTPAGRLGDRHRRRRMFAIGLDCLSSPRPPAAWRLGRAS